MVENIEKKSGQKSVEKEYCCPVGAALDEIGGKWKHPILWVLKDGKLRFNKIYKALPDITQRMLTKQLRDLEEDDLILRKVYAEVPPKVEYSLTEKGESIIPIIEALSTWGEKYCGSKNYLYKLD